MSQFDKLIKLAKAGEWDVVDARLKDEIILEQDFLWALKIGITHPNENIRDFAATVLMVSSKTLTTEHMDALRAQIATDTSNIVQFRIAMALYKRSDRSEETVAMVRKATHNSDVATLANECLKI